MCGIIGYSGPVPSNTDKLRMLLYMNSMTRGQDNTGIYTKESGIVKTATKAEEFLTKNDIPSSNLFIGHVRKASVGNKDAKNAHPFEFDNLIGVHNGTLENHWAMINAHPDYSSKDFDVDTQVLYKLLDDDSKKEGDVNFNTLTEFLGAAALVFTDKRRENVLYAYRTSDRPLYYGMLEENQLYISSLEEGLKIIGCKDIKSFFCNNLYTIIDGKIESNIYYKQKQKVYTNIMDRTPSNCHSRNCMQPVRDNDYYNTLGHDSDEEDVYANYYSGDRTKKANSKYDGLKSMSSINGAELNGRWIKCISSYNDKIYIDNVVKITEGNWYYVCDYSAANNYDIEVYDDNGNKVKIAKYIFSDQSLTLIGYVTVMRDILSKDGTRTLFKIGEVIEVIDSVIKARTIEVFSKADDKSYVISVEAVRQASVEEMESVKDDEDVNQYAVTDDTTDSETPVDKSVDPLDEIFNKTASDDTPFKIDEPENFDKNSLSLGTAEEIMRNLNKSDVEIIEDEKEQDDDIEDEDEVEDRVVNFSTLLAILDKIDDEAIYIDNLAQSTDFAELKEATATLRELVTECRDVEYVESSME